MARQYGERDKVIVQIASHQFASSGGQTALTVNLDKVEDGVAIQIGKQAWLGVLASLGTTVLSVWRNPLICSSDWTTSLRILRIFNSLPIFGKQSKRLPD